MSGEIYPYCVREEIRLPNEILAIIIENIVSDRNESRTLAALASCRLASSLLYSLATPLLFSSIQLQLPESLSPWARHTELRQAAFKERVTNLKQILTTSDFGASVHTLALRCRSLGNSINGTLISEIIDRLPHIRTFILEELEFSAITEDSKLAIKALCTTPNLTTLHLGDVAYFPITVITACHTLQCLRLLRVSFSFEYTNLMDETSSLQLYKLDSLEIDEQTIQSLRFDDSDSNGKKKEFGKIVRRIKNLRIGDLFFNSATLRCGWDIMLQASQNLTTLHLPDNESYPTTLPNVLEVIPFDLGRFPALRHFKIQIGIWCNHNVTMLGSLSRLLSVSSSTSGIETLEIMIDWFNVMTGGEKDLFLTDAGWSTLDEVLSFDKFVSLKKVVLCLKMQGGTRRKAYYHNQDLGRSLDPPYVNTFLSTFRALTSTQCTLELHVEIV